MIGQCATCAHWRPIEKNRRQTESARCSLSARYTLSHSGCTAYVELGRAPARLDGRVGPRRVVAQLALLAGLFLALLGAPASAQRPNWDLRQLATDQYGLGDVSAPRAVHHALHAVGGIETSRLLRAVGVPDRASAIGGGLLVGVVPHVVGVSVGAYPFNGPDWLADAWIGAAPTIALRECARRPAGQRRGWRRCAVAAAVVIAGYAVLYPHASP